ncbi:MAG: NADH-quinone oxidoreductase subunit N, partial [Phycisphaerae bacterium]|nr:NADH-quinone oxidoreductase subunit N [Phycisphaerae bacterium]
LLLSVVGVCFKIAAVPMHFYAADVYEGAATPVTAFLAFVPKAAGFVTLVIILETVGWSLGGDDQTVTAVLWILAVATMFVGNTLALLQGNVKRLLAYSSIAHSGYMLVGLVAGPVGDGPQNGVSAILFYLVAYGVMNTGAFAVLGLLARDGEEADDLDDLRGLGQRRPGLAVMLSICVLSLVGLPPLVGFWGKLYLFSAAISAGYVWLAVFGVINSAIAAYYYLRIIGVCYLSEPSGQAQVLARPARMLGAAVSATAVVVLSLVASPLIRASDQAGRQFLPGRSDGPVQVDPAAPPASKPGRANKAVAQRP